jgi:hypothetical protein
MSITCSYTKNELTKAVFYLTKLNLAILLFFIQSTAYGQWLQKADELHQTAEGNNIVYRNKLYVFGGFSQNPVIEKRNEVYDPATDKWTDIAPFPAGKEITHNGMVLVDDNVWLIGGRAVDSHGPVSNQVIIYNITTNKWINGPGIINPATGAAFPLGGGGYALLGRTIHVFGGFGPTICEDQGILHLTIDVDKYIADPTHVTWENKLAPMPIPRNHISYITLSGKIYALGGQFQHDCGAGDQKYCQVYDPNTDSWTRLTDLPVARSHAEASSFALDGKILLIAGQGLHDIPQNTVYEFNPGANNGLGSWTNKTSYKLPGNFLGLSSKVLGTKIIITNGAKDNYANSRKETYWYNVGRTITRTFGFGNLSIAPTIDSGGKTVFKNLLYVIEDSVAYNITSNQKWLTVTKNGSGTAILNGKEIEFTIDAANLTPGKYTAQATAKGVGSSASATFDVNLVVSAKLGYTITVIQNGSGSVIKVHDQPTYNPGDSVTLTAQPSNGWSFDSWSTDIISKENPLTFYINGDKTITANFIQDSVSNGTLITNIQSTTTGGYASSTLTTGAVYYTDRDYHFTAIPSAYNNLPSIITANDDKLNNSSSVLTFNLTAAATVYICYDPRATKLPAWLSTWQKLPDKIGINDPKLNSFNVYSKSYPSGTVILGGNLQSPAKGTLCAYIVFAKAAVNNINKVALKSMTLPLTATYSDTVKQAVLSTVNQTNLVLYPNPAKDSFNITLPENFTGLSEMMITDIYGKGKSITGSSVYLKENTLIVNPSSLFLKPGLYYLRIKSKNGQSYFATVVLQRQ